VRNRHDARNRPSLPLVHLSPGASHPRVSARRMSFFQDKVWSDHLTTDASHGILPGSRDANWDLRNTARHRLREYAVVWDDDVAMRATASVTRQNGSIGHPESS
jgi:hypothetical protein